MPEKMLKKNLAGVLSQKRTILAKMIKSNWNNKLGMKQDTTQTPASIITQQEEINV